MQVISRSSGQFSYLSLFPGEGSLITRLYYLVSAQRVQTAASGYSSWLGSLSEVRNTAVGFKWKTHHRIGFLEAGETLKAAGWRGVTSDGSTAGQRALSPRSGTLLCLVSSQQRFNGAKWTERGGKLCSPVSCVDEFSHSRVTLSPMGFSSSGSARSNLTAPHTQHTCV